MPAISVLLAALALCCICSPARADDFFKPVEIEDQSIEADDNTAETSAMNLAGFIQQRLGVSADDHVRDDRSSDRLASAKTQLFLEADGDWGPSIGSRISARGEAQWYVWDGAGQQWDAHYVDYDVRDAFVDIELPGGAWLRMGQQPLVWGTSEGIRVTDILSPTDQREIGITQVRDIKEPIPAIMMSNQISQSLAITKVIATGAGADRQARTGEPFDIISPLKAGASSLKFERPDNEWEYALKLDLHLNGVDFSLIGARINANERVAEHISPGGALVLRQPRQTVYGTRISKAIGSVLVNSEVAWRTNSDGPQSDQVRGALSVEFFGFNDWHLTAELNAINFRDGKADHADSELGAVLGIQNAMFNQRLVQRLTLLKLLYGNGSIARYDLTYDYSDSLKVGVIAAGYAGADSDAAFSSLQDNDAVFVLTTYYF